MGRSVSSATSTLSSSGSAKILSKVIADVAVGDLACYHDGLGITGWRNPPALPFEQGLRLPYASLDVSKTQRGSTVVPESIATTNDNNSSCVLTNGNVVVVYSSGGTNLRFAIYTPSGTLVKAVTQVVALTSVYTDVAALADGGFVIVHNNGSNTATHVRYDAAGNVQSSTSAGGSCTACAVAGLTSGGYVVAFVESNAAKFARYDASGNLQGAVTTIEASTVSSSYISVAALTGGGYVVTWCTTGPAVKFARYDNAGALQGAVTTVAAHSAAWPVVAGLTNGGFAIAYLDTTPNYPKFAIYSGAGAVVKAVTQLTSVTGASKLSIAGLINGGFAIAYLQGTSVYFLDASGKLDPVKMSYSAAASGGYLGDINAMVDGGLFVFGSNSSGYPSFGFFSTLAITVVGAVTISAAAGATATIETLGVMQLSGTYAESKSFTHTGSTLPGNKGVVFNGSIYMKGLS